ALDIVHVAARPHDLNKGPTNSCAASSTAEELMRLNPSQGAAIAAEALLSGQLSTASGETVILDPKSMIAHRQALDSLEDRERAAELGFQSQFGQVITHALTNFAHHREHLRLTGEPPPEVTYTISPGRLQD